MIRHGEAPFLECSTKGDRRFSAFVAQVYVEGRGWGSIEEHYQAFKVFEDGTTGLSWRRAKGRKAVNQEEALNFYSQLWNDYIRNNPELLRILLAATGVSDIFGKEGSACQATELWRIKNDHEVLW